MKKELFDKIARITIKEFLDYVEEAEPTVGAAAPPAGGLGTADTPAMEPPSAPPPSADLKGIHLIDPKNPAKIIKVDNLKYNGDEQALNKGLNSLVVRIAGPQSGTKVSMSALTAVKQWFASPGSALFLYIGKSDPEDATGGLMLFADKNLSNARAKSAKPDDLKGDGGPVASDTATDDTTGNKEPETDFSTKMGYGGAATTQAPRADEMAQLKTHIKKIVREYLKK